MSEPARLNRKKRPLLDSNDDSTDTRKAEKPAAQTQLPQTGVKRHEADAEGNIAAILYSLDPENSGNLRIPRRQSVRIGRSRRCDLVISAADCSSVHCQIGVSIVNGQEVLYLKDLSSNGTFVNGTLAGKGNTCLIRNGDRLGFASSCQYIVKYSESKNRAASFFDSYILSDNVLGTGHYAQVREAVCRKTGEVCAVKIFNPSKHSAAGEEDTVKFNRELDILTKLDHPNVVKFYGTFLEPVSEDQMTTYLVLEKVNGGELFNRVVKKGKLGQDETQDITRQLLTGLKYLHSMGIVHRDLKPENILLEIERGEQQYPWGPGEKSVKVKIADFGLAKFIGKLSFTNTLCGTPAYVAPEVLVNQQIRRYNKSVDMWSVGVLLYVCLCGFPPFSEELGPPSMRQQIIDARFAFYSPYWDKIADDALDLIARLLVADPNKRLTVEQAINHVWMRTEEEEVVEEKPEARKQTVSNILSTDVGQNLLDLNEETFSGEDNQGLLRSPSSSSSMDLRVRQLSIRIPATSRGYSCEPITLQKRVQTGMDDETIARTFCTFEKPTENEAPVGTAASL
ncbi:DEKNAAC101488 [Brettanomyces naardenensis]|uniref:DEKNAAC101488 n=1 Tax=Brettanomyces naardenensis TaxID=13370 RepID=A0A448YHX8_BRENA|nr:DEKNAAC101488 [Brettanomyces naardenensis]